MKMMVHFKFINTYVSKGKCYAYYRRGGKRIKVEGEMGTPEFAANYRRIHGVFEGEADFVRPGSLGALAEAYLQNPSFRELAARTQKDYQSIIDFMLYNKDRSAKLRDMPLSALSKGEVKRLRDAVYSYRGWKTANKFHAVLSVLCSYAVSLDLIPENPCIGMKKIKRPQSLPSANRPWTDQEREAVVEAAPDHLLRPIMLAMYTGMRTGDILKLKWSDISENTIGVSTGKTGQNVYIPICEELGLALNPNDSLFLCLNSRGLPWTPDGFKTSFMSFKNSLEKTGSVGAGLTMHGLRHTVAKTLVDAGASIEDIQALLGHANSKMTSFYAKEADAKARSARVIPFLSNSKSD